MEICIRRRGIGFVLNFDWHLTDPDPDHLLSSGSRSSSFLGTLIKFHCSFLENNLFLKLVIVFSFFEMSIFSLFLFLFLWIKVQNGKGTKFKQEKEKENRKSRTSRFSCYRQKLDKNLLNTVFRVQIPSQCTFQFLSTHPCIDLIPIQHLELVQTASTTRL